MVSHESIYKFVYQDKDNGGLLYKNLRAALKSTGKDMGPGKVKDVL